MLRFTYTSLAVFKYTEEHNYKAILKVTAPDWDLQQLTRQIHTSIGNAEIIKHQHQQNWLMPELLKDKVNISYKECDIFIAVMRAFSDYLEENKDNIKLDDDLAVRMIRSVFMVQGDEVVSSSLDEDLNAKVKQAVSNTGYTFTTDKNVFEDDE